MFTSHSSVHVHKINVLTQAKGKDIDREFGMSYWSWERFIPGNSSIPPGYRTNVIALALSHSFSSSVFGVNVLFPWVRYGPYSQYFFVPGVLVNLPLGCGGVRDFEVDYLVTHP